MATPETAAVVIPPFIQRDPALWFYMIESTFEFASPKPITESKTKYNYAVSHLPPDIATVVRDPCLFLCKPFLASISPITSDKASEVADRILAISPHAINAVSASGASPSSVTDRRSSTDMLLDDVKALRKEVADLRRSRSQFRHNNVRRKRSNSRSSPPVAAKPRRLAPDRLKIAKAEFQHMIKLNHIRPSKSAYASPLHMASKEAIAKATLLKHPIPGAQLSLWVDTSNVAVGGSLMQLSNDQWEPLAFYSSKLNKSQKNWSTYDRELFSIYSSVKKFKHMLEGRTFVIYTDQKPLTYAFQQHSEKCSPRQLRHLDFISQFSTDIRYTKGSDNTVADALS
ncbi:transposon Ty3-I Gag-Pol polyprotein [Trichonephila clavipes]|nr:transposon Ty3-I Gag-Pol polyprotein [Trichonephila clavipes]